MRQMDRRPTFQQLSYIPFRQLHVVDAAACTQTGASACHLYCEIADENDADAQTDDGRSQNGAKH